MTEDLSGISTAQGVYFARVYFNMSRRVAMQALADGPDIAGSNLREDIAPGIRILHVARMGRKGRHFIVFRAGPARTIDVLRLLHDSMDLPRQLARRGDSPD